MLTYFAYGIQYGPMDFVFFALPYLCIIVAVALIISGVRNRKPFKIAFGLLIIVAMGAVYGYSKLSDMAYDREQNARRLQFIAEMPDVYLPNSQSGILIGKPELFAIDPEGLSYRVPLRGMNSKLAAFHTNNISQIFNPSANNCNIKFLFSRETRTSNLPASECMPVYESQGKVIYADATAARASSQYGYYAVINGNTVTTLELDKKMPLGPGGVIEETSPTRKQAVTILNNLRMIPKDNIENHVSVYGP